MQFMLLLLDRVEVLDTLLERFMENSICGATILNSTGMVRELAKCSVDFPSFWGSLRMLIVPEIKES